MAAAQDQTAQRFESHRHDDPHSHPVPVPHLKPEWDNHGPDVSHPHQHIRGGGHRYDRHNAYDPDHGRPTPPDDHDPDPALKLDPATADDSP